MTVMQTSARKSPSLQLISVSFYSMPMVVIFANFLKKCVTEQVIPFFTKSKKEIISYS